MQYNCVKLCMCATFRIIAWIVAHATTALTHKVHGHVKWLFACTNSATQASEAAWAKACAIISVHDDNTQGEETKLRFNNARQPLNHAVAHACL